MTFAETVQAVKDKNYQHAVNLFELQAFAAQHDAQYNLALLLNLEKGGHKIISKHFFGHGRLTSGV